MLTSLMLTSLSFLAIGDDAAPQAPVDAKAELVQACRSASGAESYSFELISEGGGGGRGGFGRFGGGRDGGDGEGDGEQRAPEPTVVQYRSGLPMHVTLGETEAYVLADTTVWREGEGEWQLFDREAMRGGFGGRGGRAPRDGGGSGGADGGDAQGGGSGGAEGGDAEGRGGRGARGGRGGRGRGGVFGLMRVTRAQPPHALLADVEGKVTDVTRVAHEDGTVEYTGKLTEEAAEGMMSMGFGGGRGGRGGFGDGEGPERDVSGTFSITTDAAGAISAVVLNTHLSMTFGDRDIERDSKSTYKLSGWNATDYEVPEEALIHFEF